MKVEVWRDGLREKHDKHINFPRKNFNSTTIASMSVTIVVFVEEKNEREN